MLPQSSVSRPRALPGALGLALLVLALFAPAALAIPAGRDTNVRPQGPALATAVAKRAGALTATLTAMGFSPREAHSLARDVQTGDVRGADLELLMRRTGAGQALGVSEANRSRQGVPVKDPTLNAPTGDHAPPATAAPSRSAAAVTVSSSGGFDWGDAAIGAGVTFGLGLLIAGAGVAATRRRAGHTATS